MNETGLSSRKKLRPQNHVCQPEEISMRAFSENSHGLLHKWEMSQSWGGLAMDSLISAIRFRHVGRPQKKWGEKKYNRRCFKCRMLGDVKSNKEF